MNARNHFRKFVIGLRAEHEVDSGLATHNFFALSLCYAACDAEQHFAAGLLLQALKLAKFGENLFGCLFTDVTRVQKHQISIVCCFSGHIAQWRKHVFHPFGIIDVHLAAIGFDKEAFGRRVHFRSFSQDFSESSSGTP